MALALAILPVLATPVRGQVFTCFQTTKLTASDTAAGDLLGRVAVSGDVAVVGASSDDCAAGADCGSAYVYRFNGSSWLQEQKLTASDAATLDSFGLAVSIGGEAAVVGTPNDDCPAGTLCGSAYVFRFNGVSWMQEQKLTASDAADGDRFGISVSVDGDVAIVGAWGASCAAGAACGAAYLYRFNGSTWNQEQKLTASDAAAFDEFGFSVSVDGAVAVVGAYEDDCAAGAECGSAYVFRFNGATWVEEQKLVAADAAAVDFFGVSTAVQGSVALVGANWDNCPAGGACGSAYVFRFNGASWVQEQKLAASDAAAGDRFGSSVSLAGDVALIGSRESDCAAGSNCGSAYVFRFNGSSWDQIGKMFASDAAAGDVFGGSVSTDGAVGFAGAVGHDCGADANCGAAYVFSCQTVDPGPVPALSQRGWWLLIVVVGAAGAVVFGARRPGAALGPS